MKEQFPNSENSFNELKMKVLEKNKLKKEYESLFAEMALLQQKYEEQLVFLKSLPSDSDEYVSAYLKLKSIIYEFRSWEKEAERLNRRNAEKILEIVEGRYDYEKFLEENSDSEKNGELPRSTNKALERIFKGYGIVKIGNDIVKYAEKAWDYLSNL